jgi:hypothetical protein
MLCLTRCRLAASTTSSWRESACGISAASPIFARARRLQIFEGRSAYFVGLMLRVAGFRILKGLYLLEDLIASRFR